MKRAIIIVLLGLLVLALPATAQKIISPNDSYNRDYKALYIPFKESPPPYIQYVPNEIVVKLNSPVSTVSISKDTRTVVTGETSLDELHKKYKVEYFAREFPRRICRAII